MQQFVTPVYPNSCLSSAFKDILYAGASSIDQPYNIIHFDNNQSLLNSKNFSFITNDEFSVNLTNNHLLDVLQSMLIVYTVY